MLGDGQRKLQVSESGTGSEPVRTSCLTVPTAVFSEETHIFPIIVNSRYGEIPSAGEWRTEP